MTASNSPDNMSAVLTFKPCPNLSSNAQITAAARPPSISADSFEKLFVCVPLTLIQSAYGSGWFCP
jgi:hypothetical protein